MSQEGDVALSFGGQAALLLTNMRDYEASIKKMPDPTKQSLMLHPQPFPPVFVNVATGAVDANRTIRGSGRNGIVGDLMLGSRDMPGPQIGTGLQAKLEFLHQPMDATNVQAWRRLQEINGATVPFAKQGIHPRAVMRNAKKDDDECSGPSHRGVRAKGDITLRKPEGGRTLREYKVCQQLYGERAKFCYSCRALGAARTNILMRIKRKNPLYDKSTAAGKKQPKTFVKVKRVSMGSVFNMQTVRQRLVSRSKSKTLQKAIDGLARLTPSVWAGILLTEPKPQTDEAAPAQMAEIELVGGACRNGAFPAMWQVIRYENIKKKNSPRNIVPWATAMYTDDGSIAAGWCWAMAQSPKSVASCLPNVLRRDASVCAQLATQNMAHLQLGQPKSKDYTFFMTADRAVQMYSQNKALPSTVRFIFASVPGGGDTRCTMYMREVLDVLHAIKHGWKIELVLCAPLKPSAIRPKLPDNKIHALTCVQPSDLVNPVRNGVSLSTLTKPKFPSPPAVYCGEYITWSALWWYWLMVRQSAGDGAAPPPAMLPKLTIYFSWQTAKGGATKTFKFPHSTLTLTYGGVISDHLMAYALDPAVKNVKITHGAHADFTQYRKGSPTAIAAQAACEEETQWIQQSRFGAPQLAPSKWLFDLL